MRKLLTMLTLVTVTLAFSLPAVAQNEGCVFFSEYVEGSSNNKALEIYNGTGAELDLSRVTVERYNNGAVTPNESTTLAGAVASGGVYVIVNASATEELLALGDPTYSTLTFYNGDDALVLLLDGEVVDSIGRVGEDPGSAWGTDCTTGEQTLRRNVCCGDPIVDDVFDPADEWDCFPQNTFDGLGIAPDCTIVSTEDDSWTGLKALY